MGIFNGRLTGSILSRLGYKTGAGRLASRIHPAAKRARRDAARIDRLTSSWTTQSREVNAATRSRLPVLRARSRELCANNSYGRKFLKMVSTNVIGPAGIRLQNKAVDADGKTLDKWANKKIEDAWRDWGKRKYASVTGKLSFHQIQNQVVEAVARDGEAIIRKVKGFNNKYRFSLQLIEADHLDTEKNATLRNGHEIRMGIEYDVWNRPVAYYIRKKHPGADPSYAYTHREFERIPAAEICHVFIPERIGQERGLPWLSAAMFDANNLRGYVEAEIIAARIAASKMGFFTTPDGDIPKEKEDGEDAEPGGNFVDDAEPGTFEVLPDGYKMEMFDPTHPGGNFGPFVKHVLRGVASGALVSYNSLANDLEGVNYSSLRSGALEERDVWRTFHAWIIDSFHEDIYGDWLEMGLLAQAIPLPFSKYEKFNAPTWRARGWDWVDPTKDVKSTIEAVNAGLKTRRQALAERGIDLEEHYAELAEEKALAESLGLKFTTPTNEPAGGKDDAEDEDKTDEKDN